METENTENKKPTHPFLKQLAENHKGDLHDEQRGLAVFLQELVDRIEAVEDKASELDHRTIGDVVLGPSNRSIHGPDPKRIETIIKNLQVEKKHE